MTPQTVHWIGLIHDFVWITTSSATSLCVSLPSGPRACCSVRSLTTACAKKRVRSSLTGCWTKEISFGRVTDLCNSHVLSTTSLFPSLDFTLRINADCNLIPQTSCYLSASWRLEREGTTLMERISPEAYAEFMRVYNSCAYSLSVSMLSRSGLMLLRKERRLFQNSVRDRMEMQITRMPSSRPRGRIVSMRVSHLLWDDAAS